MSRRICHVCHRGELKRERSSGYEGYRCQHCAEWVYANDAARTDELITEAVRDEYGTHAGELAQLKADNLRMASDLIEAADKFEQLSEACGPFGVPGVVRENEYLKTENERLREAMETAARSIEHGLQSPIVSAMSLRNALEATEQKEPTQ